MLGKQACAVNCVPFYRGAVNSVALKQPAVQSNFPLLHKLGLAEKAAKDPTIGSVCSLAGSKISSLFLDFIFGFFQTWCVLLFRKLFYLICALLGHFWNGTWRPAKILIFDPLVLQTKTQEKNISLRFWVFQVSMRVFWPPLQKGAGWP